MAKVKAWLKGPRPMLEDLDWSPRSAPESDSYWCTLWEETNSDSVVESLPPTREIWNQVLASGFGLSHP